VISAGREKGPGSFAGLTVDEDFGAVMVERIKP
jgi:hypothetical protein